MALNPNSIAFIALANEYCGALEQAAAAPAPALVASMVRLLPRLYISACDLRPAPSLNPDDDEAPALEGALQEEAYEQLRASLAALLGPDDVYLEVFEEDMKYSDTPLSASIAEGLADIYQQLFNFISTVRDAPSWRVDEALRAVKADFRLYWSQSLVNVMRPLNQLAWAGDGQDDDDEYGQPDGYDTDGTNGSDGNEWL